MQKEKDLIDNIASILQQKMKKDYANGKMKRSAHPKNLGLLKATFNIEKNIPPEIAKGLFSTPNVYQCLIRLSSADGKVQSDKEKDFRGFAIKLVGVEGERLKNFEKQTQDFILMSYPIMPLGTLQLFHDAIFYTIKIHPLAFLAKLIFSGNLSVLKHFKKAKQHHSSSLDIRYWSTTPIRLGDVYVKFSVNPTSSYRSELPSVLTGEYLSENNALHLMKHEASFDFLIQLFKSEKETPIENAGIEWPELVSPFIKVAVITILKQDIKTEQRKELVETLAFSPANTLQAHEPIGSLNRARIPIYERLSAFRHTMNDKPFIEPDIHVFNEIV